MLTVDVSGEEPDDGAIALAAKALADGSVVAVPTDTVYGLAVDPAQPDAVDRLFAVKSRPTTVALPVLVCGWEQVAAVAGRLEEAAARLADRHWPGPLTLVVPRSPAFTADLGGPPSTRHTVGLRWPDHPVIAALCGALGPLAVTSANRHGAPPAETAASVEEDFADEARLAVILDGGRCAGTPSTVVECRGSSVRCLRDGALPYAAISAGLHHGPAT